MNAKKFLNEFVARGCGAHLDFAEMAAELVNDSAVLSSEQQSFVQGLVQMGPCGNMSDQLVKVVTFINSCR